MKTLQVLQLTVSEADRLLSRVRNASILRTYGIDITTTPSNNKMPMQDGTLVDAVYVFVTAETEVQAGIGKGWLIAIDEGISK